MAGMACCNILSPAEGSVGLALALALCPEVATHASQTGTALSVLHLGIRLAKVSPSGTPVSPFYLVKYIKAIVFISKGFWFIGLCFVSPGVGQGER